MQVTKQNGYYFQSENSRHCIELSAMQAVNLKYHANEMRSIMYDGGPANNSKVFKKLGCGLVMSLNYQFGPKLDIRSYYLFEKDPKKPDLIKPTKNGVRLTIKGVNSLEHALTLIESQWPEMALIYQPCEMMHDEGSLVEKAQCSFCNDPLTLGKLEEEF